MTVEANSLLRRYFERGRGLGISRTEDRTPSWATRRVDTGASMLQRCQHVTRAGISKRLILDVNAKLVIRRD